MTITIREIAETDCDTIATLSLELGYKIEAEQVKRQIMAIIKNEEHFAFVATIDEQVVGYIHAFHTLRLTSVPFLEIGGLVVSKSMRKQGIGKQLVKYIEQLSKEDVIRVRCNRKRTLAHKFYLDQGYLEKKEQKIFERLINP